MEVPYTPASVAELTRAHTFMSRKMKGKELGGICHIIVNIYTFQPKPT